ncbi:FCAR, partial [Cervus elaphus hippelaphus]
MAFVFLVSLISFLVHHWCPDAKDAAMMNSQPEVGRRVKQEDPDAEELNEVTYTDLDCSVFTWKNITPTSQRPRESSADASLYDKPFLSTDGGQVAMPGENISLRCSSAHMSFDRFSLSRPGGATLSRHRDARLQGDFTLGPVNLSFSGVYTCYGWHSGRPYVWSAPSNALELVVTGTTSQDHMTENWIRMGMAGLVLIVLLAILAENQLGPQVLHQKDQQDLPDLHWSRQE